MGLTKDKLIYDPADVGDSDEVGSWTKSGDDGTPISATGSSLDVNVTNSISTTVSLDSEYAEDSAHGSGDIGQFVMAVRNDTQGSLVGSDGDYAPLQVDSAGRLRVISDIDLTGDLVGDDEADSEDPLKIGYRSTNAALAALSGAGDKANAISDLYRRLLINDSPNISVLATKVTVGTSAVALPATALAGRRDIIIKNASNNAVFLGGAAVTASGATEGVKLEKGGSVSMRLGEFAILYAIAGSAGNDIEVMELA